MKKKKQNSLDEKILIEEREMETEIIESFDAYSKYTLIQRAIPNLYDNKKPVQRRIIWTMCREGMLYNKPRKKLLSITGLTTLLHEHGDSSIINAATFMGQEFRYNCSPLDTLGHWGTIIEHSASAARYIEARLSKYAETCLIKDLNPEIVPFVDNYDETLKEPTVLPAVVPEILINPNIGVAVGFTCGFAPHNPREVTEACIAYVKNRNITFEEITKIIKGPDFPTGGIINGKAGFIRAYKEGIGSVVNRGTYRIEETKGYPTIVITSPPYMVSGKNLMEQIVALNDNDKIDIRDIRQETGYDSEDPLRIAIVLKKGEDIDRIMNIIYKYTDFETKFNLSHYVTDDKNFMLISLMEIIRRFVAFREDIIYKRLKLQLRKLSERAHILDGVIALSKNLDKAIDMIKKSKGRTDAIEKLVKSFKIDNEQAEYVVDMKLHKISSFDISEVIRERKELEKEMKVLTRKTRNTSNSDIDDIMIEEWESLLNGIFKNRKRRTKILEEYQSIKTSELIKEEKCTLILTQNGYLKYIPDHITPDTYVDNEVFIKLNTINTSTVSVITNQGRVFNIHPFKLDQSKRGTLLRNVIKIKDNETLVDWFDNMNEYANITTITSDGMMKKTAVKDLFNIGPSGRVVHNLAKNAYVVRALPETDDNILVVSKDGNALRLSNKAIKATGLGGIGVGCMKLKECDIVANASLINDLVGTVIICNSGHAKVVDSSEYKVQNRDGYGVMTIPSIRGTEIIYAGPVSNRHLIITAGNKIYRQNASDIKPGSKTVRGSKLQVSDITDVRGY